MNMYPQGASLAGIQFYFMMVKSNSLSKNEIKAALYSLVAQYLVSYEVTNHEDQFRYLTPTDIVQAKKSLVSGN